MKSSLNSTLASLRGVAKGCAVVVVVLAVVVDVPVVMEMVTVVASERYVGNMCVLAKFDNKYSVTGMGLTKGLTPINPQFVGFYKSFISMDDTQTFWKVAKILVVEVGGSNAM